MAWTDAKPRQCTWLPGFRCVLYCSAVREFTLCCVCCMAVMKRANRFRAIRSAVSQIDFGQVVHPGAEVGQEEVQDGDQGHAFHDDGGAGHDDRVVAAMDGEVTEGAVGGEGALGLRDRGSRLEGGPQDER